MSEEMFTPGPWYVDAGFESSKPGDFDEYWQVHDGADAIACSSNCYAENREANAHLIAAAPVLYEAIKKMQKIILDDDLQETVPPLFWEVSAAALAKARGES